LAKEYTQIKKNLAFIPDTPFLYDNLTPLEFLQFVKDVYEIEDEVFSKKINTYFSMFKLDDYRSTLIRQLSHGTKQKIIYIANFIHSPLIYFIDEPLVGLDPRSIHLLKKILKNEVIQGKTILMCTHILSIAEDLADRIGILNKGELVIESSPCELAEKVSACSLEEAFLKITDDQ